jgi:hypothetical protein
MGLLSLPVAGFRFIRDLMDLIPLGGAWRPSMGRGLAQCVLKTPGRHRPET